jgi:hypothetical protein
LSAAEAAGLLAGAELSAGALAGAELAGALAGAELAGAAAGAQPANIANANTIASDTVRIFFIIVLLELLFLLAIYCVLYSPNC